MKLRFKTKNAVDTERRDVLSGLEDRPGAAVPGKGPKSVKHALIERAPGRPAFAVSDKDSAHQEGFVVHQIWQPSPVHSKAYLLKN